MQNPGFMMLNNHTFLSVSWVVFLDTVFLNNLNNLHIHSHHILKPIVLIKSPTNSAANSKLGSIQTFYMDVYSYKSTMSRGYRGMYCLYHGIYVTK